MNSCLIPSSFFSNSLMELDEKDSNFIKLYSLELEYLCQMFSRTFKIDQDLVLKEGFRVLTKEYPDQLTELFLSDEIISNLNVQEIKDELKIRNLGLTGNKETLQNRLSEEIKRRRNLFV